MNTEKKELQALCGAQVQFYRNQLGITQEALAMRVGTEQNYISQIESGRKMMSLEMLRKMSVALGVSADALLFARSESAKCRNILKQLDRQSPETIDGIEALVRLFVEKFGQRIE